MKRRLIGSLAGLALAAGAMVGTAVPGVAGIDPDPLDPQTFDDPSANPQSYTVPDGCTEVTIEAFGAEGGDSDSLLGDNGGFGGIATTGPVPVTPGEVLTVEVGGAGEDTDGFLVVDGGAGGVNGGGAGGNGLVNALGLLGSGGGGGGGLSRVLQGGMEVVTAGGGGGGGAGLTAILGGAGGDGSETGTNGESVLLGGVGGMSGGNGGAGGGPGLIGGGTGGNGTALLGGDGGDALLQLALFGGGGGGGGVIGGGGGGAGGVGTGGGGGGGGNSAGPGGTVFGTGETGDGRVIIDAVNETCEDGEPPVRDCTDPPPIFFQPDATRETPRLGNDVYDDGSPEFQTQFESVKPRFGSTLDIYIQNDGNAPDSFVLTGLPSSTGFLVRYQQLKAADGSLPKNFITEDVTGAGFTTGTLAPCGEMKVRILVKVSVNAPIGSQVDLPLTVTSTGDGTTDTARLVVTVVAP